LLTAEEAAQERKVATDADDSIDGLNVGLTRGGQHEHSRAQWQAVGVGIGRVAIGTSLVLNATESAARSSSKQLEAARGWSSEGHERSYYYQPLPTTTYYY
jgi:hypothetical protein